ncbi:glutathione peroxidase [Stenotrophomonas sp. YAU14D1_LEIMI4_1]|uniref:glutathione peroxidase n=1 Tax=Stenotrophomonas sp. YAU14D1_LEIMI4_1 TaxID=2072407 RepID=UPI000D53C87B|nr:glutathione peroxidase [Stenotrophomonas sp. YAU14D1_LEIMI4_1]AWH27351.1 glutathione peroxidase [Stenotrophomonas sp. YAU14D1_LEIMI4_1]
MPVFFTAPSRLRGLSLLAVLALGLAGSASAVAADLLDVNYRPLAGKQQVNLLKRYQGQVLLVVNTASKCGYTPQYEGLEALQKQYASRGFAVLGFPSNDFKGQEPGDEKQIQDFCTLTYGVKFPMFEKVHVVGEQATPLYQRLTAATGVAPGWNFHKYLIGRDGKVIAQFASKVTPDDPQLGAAISKALAAPAPR